MGEFRAVDRLTAQIARPRFDLDLGLMIYGLGYIDSIEVILPWAILL